MTSKERVLCAVHYQDLDRLPATMYNTTLEYEMHMAEYFGTVSLERLYRVLGLDLWRNRCLPVYLGKVPDNMRRDNPAPFAEFHTVDQVEAYPFPPIDYDMSAMLNELKTHQEFAVIAGTMPGGYTSGIYHLYLEMCGMENGFIFLKQQPEVAKAMIRRLSDYWLAYSKMVLEAGHQYIDIFQNANDFGTQRSLAISPEDFRYFFKPELKRFFDLVKNYGLLCMQHSCGAIEPIINDFIEAGADILNPIQVTAKGMDIETLHSKYFRRIVFFGGIDTQFLLPKGPEFLIRADIRRMKYLFPTGYILAPSQEFKDDIPLLHAIAIFDENLREYK